MYNFEPSVVGKSDAFYRLTTQKYPVSGDCGRGPANKDLLLIQIIRILTRTDKRQTKGIILRLLLKSARARVLAPA